MKKKRYGRRILASALSLSIVLSNQSFVVLAEEMSTEIIDEYDTDIILSDNSFQDSDEVIIENREEVTSEDLTEDFGDSIEEILIESSEESSEESEEDSSEESEAETEEVVISEEVSETEMMSDTVEEEEIILEDMAESLIFNEYLTNGSYHLLPEDGEIRCNLPIGEIITIQPELRFYENEQENYAIVTDQAKFRWEYDTNAVEITEKTADDQGEDGETSAVVSYELKKLENWGTDVTLIAEMQDENGEWQEVARRRWRFEELDYSVFFENLRGEDQTWIYSDEEYDLSLNLNNVLDKASSDRVSLKIEAGTWNEETEQLENLLTEEEMAKCFTISQSEDGSRVMILHGSELSKIYDPKSEQNWFNLNVEVLVDGKPVSGMGTGINVRNPVYDYDYPNCRGQLPHWDFWIEKYRNCYVENSENPYGRDVDYEITDVQAEVILEESESADAVECRMEMDEEGRTAGWNLHMNYYGHAVVTVTYLSIEDGEEKTYSFDIWVGGESYELNISSSTYTDQLLPGAELDLRAEARLDCYDEERGHYDGDISNLSIEWNVPDGNAEEVCTWEQDENDPYILHVRAKENGERRNVRFEAKIFVPDGEDEDEEPDEVAYADFWVNVADLYYSLMPVDWHVEESPQNINLSEEIDFNTTGLQLLKMSTENPEGEDLTNKSDVRIRMMSAEEGGFDSKIWDIREGTENNRIPVLVRKSVNGTDVTLVAEVNHGETDEDGNEVWEELTRRTYWFDDLYYNVDMNTSYQDYELDSLYTDAFLKADFYLKDDSENQLPEGYDVQWEVFKNTESDELVECTEVSLTPAKQDSSDSVIITVNPESDFKDQDILVCATAVYNESIIETARAERWIRVKDPYYDYDFPCESVEDGQVLVSDTYFLEPELEYYLENADHPDGMNDHVDILSVELVHQFEENENGEYVDIAEDAEPIFTIEEENGRWLIHAEREGYAGFKITYVSAKDHDQTESYEFGLNAMNVTYRLDAYYPKDNDHILMHDDEVVIETKALSWYLDEEGEIAESEVTDYQLQIWTDKNGDPAYNTELVHAEVVVDDTELSGKKIRVTSLGERGDTDILVVMKRNGDTCAFKQLHVNVEDRYYEVLPIELTDNQGERMNPNIGETLDLNQISFDIMRYSIEEVPKNVTDQVRVELRYNQDHWKVSEESFEESTKAVPIGNLPILKRITSESTEIELVIFENEAADYGEEDWCEVWSKCYWFDEIWTNARFSGLRNDNDGFGNTWIYTDETEMSLRLDLEKMDLPEGFTAEWEIGTYDDNGIYHPFTDLNAGYFKLDSDGYGITIDGSKLKDYEETGISVTLKYGDQVIGGGCPLCRIYDPCVELYFNGRKEMLLGDVYEFPEGSISCWVENADYPRGKELKLGITSITSTNDDVILCSKDENGIWFVKSLTSGSAEITIHTESKELGVQSFTYNKDVRSEVYYLEICTETGQDVMLPDQQLRLIPSVISCTYEGGERLEEDVTGQYQVTYSGYDDSLISISEDGIVTSKRANDFTNVDAQTTIYAGSDSEYQINCSLCIYVNDDFTVIELDNLNYYTEEGRTVDVTDLKAKLVRYNTFAPQGVEKKNAVFKFENPSQYLTISDDGSSLMIADTIPEEESPYNHYVDIVGYVPDEYGMLQEYNRRTVWMVLGHTWDKGIITKAPGCTEDGERHFKCTDKGCVAEKTEVLPKLGHTFGGWEETKAATCTEDGTLTRSCQRCDTTETATIPATGHSFAEEKKEATCTDSGYTQQKCSVCDKVQDGSYDETAAPLGHDYSKWTVTKAATCTEKGEQRSTCSRCGDKDSEEITATGHNYVAEEKAATCTEDGYSQNKCTVCGEVKDGSYEKVEATGHAYGDKVYTKEATCTENGAFTQTCNNCGYVLQGLENMTGHSFAEDRQNPTCTEDGYTQQKCSRCQIVKDYQILPATGHTFGDWKVTEAATCTKEGTENRTCACGETETRTISMIAHDWETRILKEATNTEEGEEAEFCKVCGTEKPDSRRVIPMISHQMGEWTVVKEATCTEAGSRQRTCTYENCTICTDGERYVQTEVIPALGHNLEGVEWKTEKEATCTEEGIRTKTCNKCHNVVETETVEKLPHTYVSDGKAATCTTDGYAQMICENCQTIKEGSFTTVPKTGHIFGVGKITVAPTCTDQGLITFACEKCGAKRIGVLPLLGHKWKTTVEKEATCSSTGIQDLRCEDCGIVQEDSEETIELKPHTWSSEVTVDNQPTCTENGQQSIHCTKCHAILESSVTVLPATGHDYAEKTVPATCTSDGSVQKVCKVCGDTQTEILTKTGHTMKLDAEQSTMATCIDDGILVYTCRNDGCGKKEYRVQGALDHSFGEEQTKEETDTENGKIYKVCSRCEEEEILSIIPSIAQQRLIDTVKTGAEAKNTNEAIAAISQIDKEILLSDTEENLVSAVEDLLINNGTLDGTKYAQTVIAGDLPGTVTGATITAATVNAQTSEPAAVLMSMDARTLEEDVNDSQMMVVSDDLVPLAEGTGDTVQSTLHVKKNTGTNENGKPYLDMTLSMTVGEVPVSELATPITPTFIAPEAFWATEGTIVTADNKEQKVTVASDGTFTFTTAVLGTVRLTVENCTGTHTKPENVTVKQATCTDPATETYTCSKCKTVVTETTAEAEGHDYSVVMTETPATCKASGEQTLKCSKCEATTRKTLPKSNIHSYTWTTKQEVTCTTDGEKEGICSVCNDVCNDKAMITIPATGHKYDETFTEDKPATCKEEGSESRHCKNGCGAKVDTRSIPKLNHVFNTEDPNLEWTLAKSCSEKDSAVVTCSNSNCTETKTIYRTAASPTAHSWDETQTISKPSTCTAAGSETKICDSCGYTHTEELPLKAHTLVKTEGTPATCAKSGNKEYWTCKECMHVFADAEGKKATTVSECVIPATGKHTMVEKVDKKATCGTAGSKHNECSVCGKKNPATVIPATGAHTFGSYTVTKKPTVLATGTETRTCSVCGTKENRTIAKLNGTIKLTSGSLPLQIKKSFALSRIVTGLSEGDSIASFTSDKPNVATVDRSGKVTGKAAGTAVITITLASKTSAKVKVVVQKKAVVTKSIGNISRSWNAKIGEKKQLAPVISPLTTTDKLTYSSSNKKVATVSSKGQIVAKKAGTAKITVKSGKKKVVVNVKVAPTPPTGMTGVAAAKTLKKGKSFTIKPKLTPTGAEAKISFKSSNSKIAAVNSKGKVTAKKAGTAVITVKAGNVVRTCTITVN